MSNIIMKKLIYVLGISLLLWSCAKEDKKEEPTPPPVVVSDVTTISLTSTGALLSTLSTELGTVSKLKIKGIIDARDFVAIRDYMPNLISLDLSEATIIAYTGNEGTILYKDTIYAGNTIPAQAFYSLTLRNKKENLSSIILPNSITSISDYAFSYCTSLDNFTIPSMVTSIGKSAFSDCDSLSSINIPETVTSIGSYAFFACSNLSSFTFSSKMYLVSEHVLESCPNLQTVTLPSSISYIKDFAFANCTNLSSVYIYKQGSAIDLFTSQNAFYGVNKTTCTIYVPLSLILPYTNYEYWSDFTHIVGM